MKFQAKTENIVVQIMNNETMVYDLTADKVYLLNDTSAFVWQMCDGENDLPAIAAALARETKQPINEEIVKLAIDQLRANDLLDEPEQAKDFFTKTSRRKAIKQIGLATMIALPVIYSLTAPTMAQAASNRTNIANCQPCSQPAQCASGKCNRQGTSYNRICSGGMDRRYTLAPGYNLPNYRSSPACIYTAGRYCCSGNGATFTNNPASCMCNS